MSANVADSELLRFFEKLRERNRGGRNAVRGGRNAVRGERNHQVLFPGPSVVECCCRIPVLSVVSVQHFNTVELLTFDSSSRR